MDAIAGREVAAALGDADDGFAAHQLFGRKPVVHEALEIERHHVDVLAIVEPLLRAKTTLLHALTWPNRPLTVDRCSLSEGVYEPLLRTTHNAQPTTRADLSVLFLIIHPDPMLRQSRRISTRR